MEAAHAVGPMRRRLSGDNYRKSALRGEDESNKNIAAQWLSSNDRATGAMPRWLWNTA
jgi:hypothetical protein